MGWGGVWWGWGGVGWGGVKFTYRPTYCGAPTPTRPPITYETWKEYIYNGFDAQTNLPMKKYKNVNQKSERGKSFRLRPWKKWELCKIVYQFIYKNGELLELTKHIHRMGLQFVQGIRARHK